MNAVIRRATISILLCMSCLPALALPPQVEADRHLKAAAGELQQETVAWPRVLESLKAAEATGAKLPESFDYHLGKALNETGDPTQALQRLNRYLERYGKRGKWYELALEQFNIAERKQAEKAAEDASKRRADEERERSRIAEINRQDEIAISWETSYFKYWILDDAGSGSCSEARSQTEKNVRSVAIRNFNCSCFTRPVDHPAWRNHTEDICLGKLQFNKKLDPSAELRDQSRSNKWGILFGDTAFTR